MAVNNIIETHPFPPYIPAGTKYLIIGSFPGKGQTGKTISETDWFYGAKRNLFWKILQEVYQLELSSTTKKKKLLATLKIGIADIILKAVRTNDSNSDSNLRVIKYNNKALKKILDSNNIEMIFFTSQFVQKIFKQFFPDVEHSIALPSPSPRYAKMSLKGKIEVYKKYLPQLDP